ncbi:alpha/beta fold hydrolase [Piscinibacter sakaiensis]|uniref:alpha/beta fold hydrolase n=1 Tax=Piscinibacter sakaiensis TaxID=1547922 RepID=UPI003AAE4CBC
MKTIDTPLLRIAYDEFNPAGSRTVVLLHGWPDSPRCWSAVAPVLAQQGWRVLVPALRGFSPTRFLDPATPRTGQLAALGRDLLDFIDALGLQNPALVGHDWGARAAAIACGLRPGVASHLVLLSVGYGTNSADQPLSLAQARNYWYHWYMATPRGQRTVRRQRREFAKIMWDTWAPAGWYAEAEFEATAHAFDNDDWPDITLHSYQHRWGHAPGDPAYDADEAKLSPAPVLEVPTLVLHGEVDTVNHPDTSAGKEQFFSGRYERRLLPGLGHFPQRENAAQVAQELSRFLEAGAGSNN